MYKAHIKCKMPYKGMGIWTKLKEDGTDVL